MEQQQQDAREQLARFAERARHRLQGHFERWRCEAPVGVVAPSPVDLLDAVTELTLRGGKRVRPALAYHAALCFDCPLSDEALFDAALSLEVLHTALLIHDDIMDRDEERRGGPTTHTEMSRRTGEPHLGTSLAILAGSLACALAQRLLTESGLPSGRCAAAAAELARIQESVIYGQHFDLVGGASPERLQDLKTTSYTTRGPVRLGALLVDAPEEQRRILEEYATPLGRAFQTRDDLLGTFGDPKRLGKPVGADLREGKRTELVRLALERAASGDRALLMGVLGRRDAGPQEIEAACAVIERTGARRDLEALIGRLTEQALVALRRGNFVERGTRFLAGIAVLLAKRSE